MGMFYAKKIYTGQINPKTGSAWTYDDIPLEKWRNEAREIIESGVLNIA